MQRSILTKIQAALLYAKEWFSETPERALEEAYNAALRIKAIEDEHFGGKKISAATADYGPSVMAYFEAELKQNLGDAKRRLAEFNASSSFLKNGKQKSVNSQDRAENQVPNYYQGDNQEDGYIILEKLKFIDQVISKYTSPTIPTQSDPSLSLVAIPQSGKFERSLEVTHPNPEIEEDESDGDIISKIETVSDKTGVLPRSILRTFNRLRKELDPKAEEEVVKKFRISQTKTIVSIRFILILIIVPLLTFQVSKNFIVGPIVDYFRAMDRPVALFINEDLEEKALNELEDFERRLRFQMLIRQAPPLSPEQLEESMEEKAREIALAASRESADAVKNVFSDLFGLAAFSIILFRSQRQIAFLKSFMDEIVYGLSDSAKAFIIILLTDIFVGYHSPHGWEVLLEGVARHLGLPENRNFIYLFIATFPVILDTVFKYWIFRYLNRISPSAVATYRNMNE